MPGPAPKPRNLRQRQNRESTRADLPSEAESSTREVPDLPVNEAGWHPMVLEWWTDLWRSPMAEEFVRMDKRGLFRLAVLEHEFWSATSMTARLAVSAEIRHVGLAFGLTPIDRRRLQWHIEQGDTAAAKTAARKTPKAHSGKDPRDILKAVS